MACDAVAEIHAPRRGSCHAYGVIFYSRQEATDAANGYPHAQRQREQFPRPANNPQTLLHILHGNQGADQRADNCWIPEVLERQLRSFEPVEHLAPHGRTHRRRGDHPPAIGRIDHILLPAPQPEIYPECNGIRECFKYPIRVQLQRTYVEISGEVHEGSCIDSTLRSGR